MEHSSISLKGAFKNYVKQFFDIFYPLPPLVTLCGATPDPINNYVMLDGLSHVDPKNSGIFKYIIRLDIFLNFLTKGGTAHHDSVK